ncbi:amylo-alpha-1,6-glucosidase [Bordetella genomosp. 9]|uniref:Glycogen debranching protein n=1 Tax=Bordetella genomosp. 9 TaxID=1416803 RepID=A0A1W6Z324_9BORD|nr:amylo-alpha-1,6-glucosidase [Bordetella genomosp. 9]ARP87233.1 glycogen debranching protein [Bordetella genomosp. 9]
MSDARDIDADEREWLEADGCGGFASGSASGLLTRRYHALLLAAVRPPAGRMVLANGMQAWVETAGFRQALTRHRYVPDVTAPADAAPCLSFNPDPWPTWRLRLKDGRIVRMECLVSKADRWTILRWTLDEAGAPDGRQAPEAAQARDWPLTADAAMADQVILHVRPLLSGRDYHALHHENPAFDFTARVEGQCVRWQPYTDVPAIVAHSNGRYTHEPDWYRNFLYIRERERGLDAVEDLATPGVFSFPLHASPAIMLLAAGPSASPAMTTPDTVLQHAARSAQVERQRRAAFPDRLRRSADAYVVARARGLTLVAGYPWFTDWGRDTFIAMRGLLLTTGRLDEARAILLEWTRHLSDGMLPNRFPDDGGEPAYNAVDASLWFVIAAHDYLAAGHGDPATVAALRETIDRIVAGYAGGTRHGIAADDDGLLRAGSPGMQLTWMDAKLGDWVVTPRIGKPVEVQALWINALRIAGEWNAACLARAGRAQAAFARRFPKPDGSGLYDVVDVDHVPGRVDGRIRPNQIFAVGGLPHPVIDGALARAVVDQVERELSTPLGLRTLAPGEPGYAGRYGGTPAQRDGAYHQGTAWPWLLGPFVQAWLRVRQQAGALDGAARREARARWLDPLLRNLDEAGLGHISEVADGDLPQRCGGAPFQAWSLGECLRMIDMLESGTTMAAPKG